MRITSAVLAFANTVAALNSFHPYSTHNSTNTTSYPLIGTQIPPKNCSAATATVYETAYAPEVTATVSKASPSAKVAKYYGYKEDNFHYDKARSVKLQSCTHPNHDAKDPKHLVPRPVGEKTQFYYAENGKTDYRKTSYFGIIDLHFKAPTVVLEHSSYITKTEYRDDQLSIEFSSSLTCEFAMTSWTKGMIIVSNSASCKRFDDDDQCYFKVTNLAKSKDGKSIILTVRPQAQSECTEGGEAQWGMYKPHKGGYTSSHTTMSTGRPTMTSSVHSTGTASNLTSSSTEPASSLTSGSTGVPTGVGSTITSSSTQTPTGTQSSITLNPTPTFPPNSTENGNSTFGDEQPTCQAPVDYKYNLPTACLGEFFDIDLDETLGYGALDADDLEFLKEATAGLDSDAMTAIARRVALHRRHLEKRLLGKFISFVKDKIVAPAVSGLKTAANVVGTIVDGAVQLATTGTISGSIRKSFGFALPNGAQSEAKQVESPWGPAILIAAYGTQSKLQADQGVERTGYLNIFCVGCGAEGNVELAGTATWSVTQGITRGELEAWADLKAALKVGVDAQIKLSREFKKNLFQIGLPGLSFGVITIGPQVRVDSRVTLEAEAEGRILAGAELNWNRAYAKVDLIEPSKSERKNFDPEFIPTFEAEGSIFVGAELGLPIGLHFGISVATWKKTVGLINEPMVKGIAKAAAKAELVGGQLSAGFTPTEGCTGIYANLSWRNRLYGNVLDVKEFDILDTGYKTIKSACIPIGAQGAGPVEENPPEENPPEGETQEEKRQTIDAPNSLYSRQTANSNELPEGVIEITDSVKNATDAVNYKIGDVPTVAYEREDGYEFTKLLSEGGEYNILFCSNGNLYVKKSDIAAGIGCGELFAYTDGAIIGDGTGRYIYYHKDTMAAAGVSRLRLGDEENPVLDTSAVALVAWNSTEAGTAPDADIDGLFFAADYTTNEFFWLVFCVYKDGQAPKVFVVQDLEAGITLLESGDVKYSVTGGDVDKCYPLAAKEDPATETGWQEFDDSLTVDADGLEFDL